MKSVSVSTTGSQVSEVSANSWNTAWLSTRPPAAWPRMRTSPTENRIENSTVNTALAVLVSSATIERRKIIGRAIRGMPQAAQQAMPLYTARLATRRIGQRGDTARRLAGRRRIVIARLQEEKLQWNLAYRARAPRR